MLNIFSYACWPSFSSCGRAVLSMNFGFRNGGEFCPLHLLAVRSRNQAGHFNLCTQVLCLQSSVQFSCSVVSDSLRPHGLQHARPPCPSPIPGAYLNSRPLSWWCHPTISSSVVPFSSCVQFFPASGSFQMRQFFASGGQILEFQLQHQSSEYSGLISFRLDWLDLLAVQGILKSLLQHHRVGMIFITEGCIKVRQIFIFFHQ